MPTLEEAMLMAEGGSEENPYIVINNDLRTITPPTSTLLLGVYNDKEVLKVPFKMPRYYDDIDLSSFSIQINYINAMRIPNFDEADDVVVEDDYITFNWTTKRSVFLKDGTVQFSVCLRLSDIEGNVSKEFNTTIGYGIVLEGIEADADSEDPEAYSVIAHMIQIKNYVDGKSESIEEVADGAISTVNDALNSAVSSINNRASSAESSVNSTANSAITNINRRADEAIQIVDGLDETIEEIKAMVKYPNQAATVSAMTDQSKIYVYTGSESGYNNGHWYYYKSGSGWTDGGTYMSQGISTDPTLSVSGSAADAKAAGDMIKVQSTQPTESTNRLWLEPDTDEYEIPTTDDLTAGTIAKAIYHLGFYIDSDGDLCQVD